MKMKQLLVLGLGVVIGGGLSVAGLSYASASKKPEVKTQVNDKLSKLITEEKAKSIMLGKVPGATISEFEFDRDDNRYDGTLIKDNYEYDVDVNAQTGDIIEFEKESINTSNNHDDDKYDDDHDDNHNNTANNSQSNNNQGATSKQNISESKAKSIMLSKVSGATFKSFEFDNDDTPEYEGELVKGSFEYEITVDAKTGKITEFSKEAIDHDDDRYDDHDDNDRDND